MGESEDHPFVYGKQNKARPASRGGYTKPDNAVRCKKCGVGKDESGAMVGTPIAAYTLSCGLPPSDDFPSGRSVAVARFARCYRCKTLAGSFILTEKGRELGIEFTKAASLLRQSNGTWFSLEELLTGKLEQAQHYPDQAQDPVQQIVREEVIDTEAAPAEPEAQEALF